jgi:excisionase family DNA binding protein
MATLLTTKEAAAELNLSEQRVRALIAVGRLKAGKFGSRAHAIRRADLKAVRNRRPGRPKKGVK